jgi:hypothetical protein
VVLAAGETLLVEQVVPEAEGMVAWEMQAPQQPEALIQVAVVVVLGMLLGRLAVPEL